jgi:hypothetical protein
MPAFADHRSHLMRRFIAGSLMCFILSDGSFSENPNPDSQVVSQESKRRRRRRQLKGQGLKAQALSSRIDAAAVSVFSNSCMFMFSRFAFGPFHSCLFPRGKQ